MSSDQTWIRKFAVAISGIVYAVKHQVSFTVHIPIAIAVVVLSAWLHLETWRWIAIVLAITTVILAELLNTAIEEIVAVLHPEHDPRIGHALDAAAGAVLVASIGAVIIGLIVLASPLYDAIF